MLGEEEGFSCTAIEPNHLIQFSQGLAWKINPKNPTIVEDGQTILYGVHSHWSPCTPRYAILTPETYPHWKGSTQDGIKHLMKTVNMEADQWQMGKTKLFIKTPESVRVLCVSALKCTLSCVFSIVYTCTCMYTCTLYMYISTVFML